ncbi:hypothetical protein B0H66DRAFT_599319 [Apodospora peruviana]|uniref:NAD(P)-binding domain-containing protein n=1 Tax=Apodospora peruviana TaxID=516989 RepID=A0AAE0IHP8_9PEZI|nr:hypothetical protein B0H66DRAFT_599319 [Apodospora peruviana]
MTKLVVAGSTGFVATEVIRQALLHPAITSVVALGRRQVPPSLAAADTNSKLKSVVCTNFVNYPDDVKKELSDADACIWTIAITPSKSKTYAWDEVCTICRDYAVTGIEAISQISHSKPFRFLYISGSNAERDQTKRPWLLADYCLMRGEAENRILAYAQKSNGAVEACVAKPGLIGGEGKATGFLMEAMKPVIRVLAGLPTVDVREMAAALLDQVVNGFEKEPLASDDLTRIGKKVLST